VEDAQQEIEFNPKFAAAGIGLGIGMALGLLALMYILFQIAPG
jgi:hypothetical protein